MRITIFDPVGMVHAVLAALFEVGCVTRAVPGNKRGSAEFVFEFELFNREAVEFDVDEDEDETGALSSPKLICCTFKRSKSFTAPSLVRNLITLADPPSKNPETLSPLFRTNV